MRSKASLRILLEVELCVVSLTGRGTMFSGKMKDTGKVKGVPDWLNSSVWSSRSSNSTLGRRHNDDVRDQATAGAASVAEGAFEENVGVGSGSSTTDVMPSGLGAQKSALVHKDGLGHKENIQTEIDKNVEGIKETAAILYESPGQKFGSTASSQIEDPPVDSWTTPNLDIPSIPRHSSPPQLSRSSFKRSSSVDVRRGQFYSELSKKIINLAELQRLASQGIPDCAGLRSTVWKLLLGYLPRNRDQWDSELIKKRSEYALFKEELLVNPSEVTRRMEEATVQDKHGSSDDEGGLLRRFEITHGEHPLSQGKASVWHQYFQDTEITEQIERDVKRTHPDMHFFSGDSASSLSNQEALKHILLIFAKLNPGIRYVQGMNEVVAPLFYVFKTDPDEANVANAEADTFFCFVKLLSDFRDHFCQQLDNSVVGIRSTMASLTTLLKRHDEELWRHLEVTTKVNPQFYAFRWITLLLTQEFSFPDCLRIWDSLLSNPDGPLEILLRICCAMLICIKSRLLAGDFTTNLKLLQHYPFVDTNHLLHVAHELRARSVD